MLKKDEVILLETKWKVNSFLNFEKKLRNKKDRFPCIFASLGLDRNMLRFGFYEDISNSSIHNLKNDLYKYLSISKEIGKFTSFVTFFNLNKDLTEYEYKSIFWDVLTSLRNMDDYNWPKNIPMDVNSPYWEFCFGQEPIFVVCNTPAHRKRKSRFEETFMITFQPRWVFDAIELGSSKGEAAKKSVRKLLSIYDSEPQYPFLGSYGDENNLEWKQYFIPDSNKDLPVNCPFKNKLKVLEEKK